MPRKRPPVVELNRPSVDMTHGFPGRIPRKQKHQIFLIEFAKSGSQKEAAAAAGYSAVWAKAWSKKLIQQYSDYVAWLQAARAQVIVKEIDVDQKMVLDEMVRIAFANEYDYLVFYDKEEVDDNNKKTGRKVPACRRKFVHELTREQMSAVIVVQRADGAVDWRWRDRDGKLFELGKHLGMFNEKLIHEHRHRHLHAHFDLSKASMGELEDLEGQFQKLLDKSGDAER